MDQPLGKGQAVVEPLALGDSQVCQQLCIVSSAKKDGMSILLDRPGQPGGGPKMVVWLACI